jgi:transcriptional regulator with XRE-family HTH domain
MAGRSELSARVKKLRGGLTQSAFAKAVQIPQARISEYEAGKKRPAPANLVAFARYARELGKIEEEKWFLGLMPTSTFKYVLNRFQRVAEADRKAIPLLLADRKLGVWKPVGPSSEVTMDASGHHLLPFSEWIATGHGDLRYVKATDDFIAPFSKGDVILVDESQRDPAKLLDAHIVAYRANHFSAAERIKLENKWAAKHLSPEEASRRRERRHFPFLRTGVFVGRLVINQTVGFLPTIEVRTNSGDTLFEYFHAPKSSGRDVWSDAIGSQFTDLSILGRYVGWLSAPPNGLPEFEELDVHAAIRRDGANEAQGDQEQKKK